MTKLGMITQGMTIQPVILTTAPGTEGKTWQEIGRGSPTAVIPGAGTTLEPGVLYETQYVAADPITTAISTITAYIGAAIATLLGVRTEYILVEGTVLRHGYMVPATAAAELKAAGLPLPTIGAIIGAIGITGLLIIIGALLIIIGLWMAGVSPVDILFKILPGMIIIAVGGVITSALPGKAKIAGIVPIGIGAWLCLQPFMPAVPPPPPCSSYTTEVDCTAAGCYWWSDNTCHSTPEGVTQVLIKEVKSI